MRRLFLLIILFANIATAQPPKGEEREFTGTVKAFAAGFGLAYEQLILTVRGTDDNFTFAPKYGRLILDHVKIGDEITVRAMVYPDLNERLKKLSEPVRKSFKRDIILSIKTRDRVLELPPIKHIYETSKPITRAMFRTFLEIPVIGEYRQGPNQVGLLFDNGVAAYNWFSQKNPIKIGDKVSFRGHRLPDDEGFVYPVPEIKDVYFFGPLKKVEGTIRSLLFKQNYVCIGMTVRTKKGEVRMGFPSNLGQRMEQLAQAGAPMIFYCSDFKGEDKDPLNPPTLQVIIHGADTINISDYGTYGGTDIRHDHKPASIKGKITQVNRSEKGKVLSVIIGNDCYIEVDHTMEKQLGDFFRRGQLMEISGDERIKAEGEVYSKDYRIITPRSVTIDGKNFLLGQQP